MLANEGRLSCYVTCMAGDPFRCVSPLRVAILALHRAAIKVGLMFRQAEVSQPIVFKTLQLKVRDIRFPPLMLCVAQAAFSGIWEAAVQANPGQALLLDVHVATLTPIGGAARPRCVAQGAVGLEFSVRGETG